MNILENKTICDALELIKEGSEAIDVASKLIGFCQFIKKNIDFNIAFKSINEYYNIINYVDMEKGIKDLDVQHILTIIEKKTEKELINQDPLFEVISKNDFKKRLKKYLKLSNYQLFEYNIKVYLKEKLINEKSINNLNIEWYILIVLTVFLCTDDYNEYANELIKSRQGYQIINSLTNMNKKIDNLSYTDQDIETWNEVNQILKDDTYLSNRNRIEEIREKYQTSIYKVSQIGYILSDLYEQNGEFDKSLSIIKEIIGIYKTACEKALNEGSFNSSEMQRTLRYYIGCIYSFAIADVDKRDILIEMAKNEFSYANIYKEMFVNNENYDEIDKKFIIGLYNSDFGALKLSEGKIKKKKGLDIEAQKCYESGKQIHFKALEARLELENLLKKKIVKKEEKGYDCRSVKRSIGISLRNIATAYFYLQKYRESVEFHEKAIKIFEELKEETDYYHTLDCVTGSYLKLFKISEEYITEKSIRSCCDYIKYILRYYNKHTDHIRYIKALEHKNELINIGEEIEDENIKKEINLLKD